MTCKTRLFSTRQRIDVLLPVFILEFNTLYLKKRGHLSIEIFDSNFNAFWDQDIPSGITAGRRELVNDMHMKKKRERAQRSILGLELINNQKKVFL